MIPIHDDNPARLTPIMTWLIMAFCAAAWFWELSLGREMDAAIVVLGFKPASLFGHRLIVEGYVSPPGWETIFTSMFLHAGWLHIGGNMLYLWIFGNNVEDAMGHPRYAVFYLASGVAAALALAFIDPGSRLPMVGASGAISGVLAAYVMLFPRARITVIVPLVIIFYPFRLTAVWVVGFWFVLQLLSAALTHANQPGVAFWAHIGGFVAGLAMTPFFKSREFPLFGRRRLKGPWG